MGIKSENDPSSDLSEMRRKRLEHLFGEANLKIEDIVKPIGEQELKEEVEKLKKEKEDLLKKEEESTTIQELKQEIKKVNDEYEGVMQEILILRQEHVGGIEETCENMQTMLLDVSGYAKKVEQSIKDMEEEKDRAVESERKLREELQIAKNEEVRNSWAELRKGEGATSMASMMGKGDHSELKGGLRKMFVKGSDS